MLIEALNAKVITPAMTRRAEKLPPLKIASLKSSGDFFIKSKKIPLQIENEIAQLKLKLQEHKQLYSSLSRNLDFSFGDDWIFCFDDLSDKESDMYIECIAQKAMASDCAKKIAELMKKYC